MSGSLGRISLRRVLSGGGNELFAAGRRVPTREMPTAPGRPFQKTIPYYQSAH
jgi:hypothetical protein